MSIYQYATALSEHLGVRRFVHVVRLNLHVVLVLVDTFFVRSVLPYQIGSLVQTRPHDPSFLSHDSVVPGNLLLNFEISSFSQVIGFPFGNRFCRDAIEYLNYAKVLTPTTFSLLPSVVQAIFPDFVRLYVFAVLYPTC